MREFGIRPLILVRRLDDCLVSLRDHLENESLETPTFTAPESFLSLERERQLDCLVDLAAPWYLDFLAGWRRACGRGEVEARWLTYESLTADPVAEIGACLGFHRIGRDGEAIRATLDRLAADGRGTRLNVGVPGRGRESLGAAQQARLDRLCAHYPDLDLQGVRDG
jgi:hypothetical protein